MRREITKRAMFADCCAQVSISQKWLHEISMEDYALAVDILPTASLMYINTYKSKNYECLPTY